jgi:hypothetical protein
MFHPGLLTAITSLLSVIKCSRPTIDMLMWLYSNSFREALGAISDWQCPMRMSPALRIYAA